MAMFKWWLLLLFCALIQADSPNKQLLNTLKKVLGVSAGQAPDHTSPPQYMLDLYNSVADSQGVVNPYNASIIRCYRLQDYKQDNVLHFNVSGVEAEETVLQAELHLHLHSHTNKSFHKIKVYQVMNESATDLKLVDTHHILPASRGWQVLHVKLAVNQWINGEADNLGLLFEITNALGEVFESRIITQTNDDNKKPLLVLFNRVKSEQIKSQHQHFNYLYPIEDSGEKYKSSARITRSVNDTDDDNVCHRQNMVVDFEDIGWSSWIISPPKFNAYQCTGQCQLPLDQTQRPTNHAAVQSIIYDLKLDNSTIMPCCVPDELLPVTILYYDDLANVVLKQYEDMVAKECGCH